MRQSHLGLYCYLVSSVLRKLDPSTNPRPNEMLKKSRTQILSAFPHLFFFRLSQQSTIHWLRKKIIFSQYPLFGFSLVRLLAYVCKELALNRYVSSEHIRT